MGNKLTTTNGLLSVFSKEESIKTETYSGKETARVTKIQKQSDGSELRATKKINKDGSITEKLERRHR